jgi:hypothetical protein
LPAQHGETSRVIYSTWLISIHDPVSLLSGRSRLKADPHLISTR